MNFYIESLECHDSKVIRELLKVFYIDAKIVEEQEKADIKITINKYTNISTYVIDIQLQDNEKTEKYQLETVLDDFPEHERANQARRLLKLAVHKLFIQYTGSEPSPWGILTGIRPTKVVHRFLDKGFSTSETILKLNTDYGVDLEKAKLITQIAELQRDFLPNKAQAQEMVSIYISIPFCPTRCHYCSFPAFSLGQWGHLMDDYLLALDQEIRAVGEELRKNHLTVQTIYIGGGTPTTLSSQQLNQLLASINKHLMHQGTVEITIEAGRPDTIDLEKLRITRDGGVNRISINPQTMSESTLRKVGRAHTPEQILESFAMARETGFDFINMDLILGLPGENLEVFENTLQTIQSLAPENITLHTLAIKRAAVFDQELLQQASWLEVEKMMNMALEWSKQQEYIPYYLYRQKQMVGNLENIGIAKKDKICLYNVQIMEERQSIIGLGVGSASKIVYPKHWTLENFYNPKDIIFYLERINEIMQKKVDKISALR